MKQKTYLSAWFEAIDFRNGNMELSVKVSQKENAVFVLDFFGGVVKIFPYDVLF